MSKIKASHNSKEPNDRKKYLSRISKSLYYGKLPQYDSLSLPLTEFSLEFFSKVKKGKSVDRLHYNDAVSMSYNACISPCSLILAMLYLDKLKENNPEYLERTPTADLFLVSLMISSKFLFDDGESDEVFIDNWASSGGLTAAELAALERDFLKAIDWRIFASDKKFFEKLEYVEQELAKIQGVARGHFTYTELEKLLKIAEICDIFRCIACISTILVATYTVGLFTILGSVYLASNVPGTSLYASKVNIDKNETTTSYHTLFVEYFLDTTNYMKNCTNLELFEYHNPILPFDTVAPLVNNNHYARFQDEIQEDFEDLGHYILQTKLDEHLKSLWYKTLKL